ncbi:hypothetical protein [Bradyrhizobium sp. Arg816]|uniref:hypothetical protein n=1 Tax=Bradyrhizobium sp. Arg816 TaxID=2998491 RepID=UPI00249DE63B|nr:hypothetical protein [Bradyrhizobium sp. Arg816]MDI3565165.1 hypothetical protein [Bradyrhizobium sp. Arg816]
MGPAVTLLFVSFSAGTLVAILFCILLFKYSARMALGLALAFVGGAILSGALAVLAATLVIGIGPTLQSTLTVVLYLAWLISASVAGGIAAARVASRLQERYSA